MLYELGREKACNTNVNMRVWQWHDENTRPGWMETFGTKHFLQTGRCLAHRHGQAHFMLPLVLFCMPLPSQPGGREGLYSLHPYIHTCATFSSFFFSAACLHSWCSPHYLKPILPPSCVLHKVGDRHAVCSAHCAGMDMTYAC